MNISFAGSVVVVAGGTGGLGRSVSLAFLQEGAKVIVTYRKDEEFRALNDSAGPNASSLGTCRA
jgi:NAD(P)-dependent dehydrogenase (short-subunit alcohol dehydrogenase family)